MRGTEESSVRNKLHKYRRPPGYLDRLFVDHECRHPQRGCGHEYPIDDDGHSGASGHWITMKQVYGWEFDDVHWRGDCYGNGDSRDGEA